MSLLELSKNMLAKAEQTVEYPSITNADIAKLNDILKINDIIENTFNSTDSANCFFKVYPDIKKQFETGKAVEVFYAYKLGFSYTGVPNKAVYVLHSLFKETEYKYPNLVLWKAAKELKIFCGKSFDVSGTIYTMKDVLDNVYGKSSKLISDVSFKAKNDDAYEVYISDTDRVALLPLDIGESLSEDDCRNLKFDTKLGIVLGDMPIRRFNGRLGITLDDYDLREAL